jgi:hypothetical protein
MDAQKVLSVLDIYATRLENMSKVAGDNLMAKRADPTVKYRHSPIDQLTKLEHTWWAIGQCKTFVEEGRMDKAFRWLGFIQGALWWQGFYSIDELAGHNKPVEEELNTDPDRK